MIVTEYYDTIGDMVLVRTYSDAGYRIEQVGTGDVFDEAIDPQVAGRTYIETSELIDEEVPEEEENEAQQLLDILTGGAL